MRNSHFWSERSSSGWRSKVTLIPNCSRLQKHLWSKSGGQRLFLFFKSTEWFQIETRLHCCYTPVPLAPFTSREKQQHPVHKCVFLVPAAVLSGRAASRHHVCVCFIGLQGLWDSCEAFRGLFRCVYPQGDTSGGRLLLICDWSE